MAEVIQTHQTLVGILNSIAQFQSETDWSKIRISHDFFVSESYFPALTGWLRANKQIAETDNVGVSPHYREGAEKDNGHTIHVYHKVEGLSPNSPLMLLKNHPVAYAMTGALLTSMRIPHADPLDYRGRWLNASMGKEGLVSCVGSIILAEDIRQEFEATKLGGNNFVLNSLSAPYDISTDNGVYAYRRLSPTGELLKRPTAGKFEAYIDQHGREQSLMEVIDSSQMEPVGKPQTVSTVRDKLGVTFLVSMAQAVKEAHPHFESEDKSANAFFPITKDLANYSHTVQFYRLVPGPNEAPGKFDSFRLNL